MSFIERLQRKPRFVRVQILWISVILVMIIIFIIWLNIFHLSLVTLGEKSKQASSKDKSIPSLFNTLREDFSIFKNKVENEINKLKGTEQEKKFEAEIIKPLKPLKLPE